MNSQILFGIACETARRADNSPLLGLKQYDITNTECVVALGDMSCDPL